jgi:putative toxin-antitoxin system antitoxin component (TIGR02293 family)
MTDLVEAPTVAVEASELSKVADLLGGAAVLRHELTNQLDAHRLILEGLPGKALLHLVGSLLTLNRAESLENCIGMSLRTLQRRKESPAKPLSREQSSRTWKFAEILAKASDILGSQKEAEAWLERPAIGLNQQRPIDLLATSAGVELVEEFLERLDYGVYA